MRYIFVVFVFLIAVVGVFFLSFDESTQLPVPPLLPAKSQNGFNVGEATEAQQGDVNQLPGTQRPEEPNTMSAALEDLIRPEVGFKHVPMAAALKTLEKIDPEKLTAAEVEALRWSLFEKRANNAIRNNTCNVLLKAKDDKLAGALIAQLKDQEQEPEWRNYCVQHLESNYSTFKKSPEILDAIYQARQDPDETVRDVCLLHLSRLAVNNDWKQKLPKWYDRTVTLAEQYLEESDRTVTERVSGIVASGHLGLRSKVKRLTELLGDRTSPLAVRKATTSVLNQFILQGGMSEVDQKLALGALENIEKRNQRTPIADAIATDDAQKLNKIQKERR